MTLSTRPMLVRARALALLVCAACEPTTPAGSGEAWPEADVLFTGDALWLGADGAYSVDLGNDRILWLFGDTSYARNAARRRSDALFLQNTVAIQTGRDPSRAFIRYYAGTDDQGQPASFFAAPGPDGWYWPAHGIRVDDTLLLFVERLSRSGTPGPWSFAGEGWGAFVIDRPDDDPSAWALTIPSLPAVTSGPQLGEAALRDGDHVYVYGTTSSGTHSVVLARFPVDAIRRADLSAPEWYCGRFDTGCAPTPLFKFGAPEFSVHHDAALDRFVWIASGGFGSTTIVWRTAKRPEGPWTSARDVYRPQESYDIGAFVYAAKAHPELDGPGLVVTYVPSAFDDDPEELAEHYYHPHFVTLHAR